MKRDSKEVVGEGKQLLVAFFLLLVILKLVFYKESFAVVFRLVVGLFWLMVLPGFSVMLYWRQRLSFFERLVVGAGVGSAIVGVASYYIALWGMDVAGHGWLPLIVIVAGIFVYYKSDSHQQKED